MSHKLLLALLPRTGSLFPLLLLAPPMRSVLLLVTMGGFRVAFYGRLVDELPTSILRSPHLKAEWPVSRIEDSTFFTVISGEEE